MAGEACSSGAHRTAGGCELPQACCLVGVSPGELQLLEYDRSGLCSEAQEERGRAGLMPTAHALLERPCNPGSHIGSPCYPSSSPAMSLAAAGALTGLAPSRSAPTGRRCGPIGACAGGAAGCALLARQPNVPRSAGSAAPPISPAAAAAATCSLLPPQQQQACRPARLRRGGRHPASACSGPGAAAAEAAAAPAAAARRGGDASGGRQQRRRH